jgi:hypothetical protein
VRTREWLLLQPEDAAGSARWAVAEVRHCRALSDGRWRVGVRLLGQVPDEVRRLLV